jgi:hypothetical protein
MVGMVSRREGDTKKYTQAWGPQKSYLVKILLTLEIPAMTAIGRKVTAVVSVGARRRGRGEEGRKIFLLNDVSSERIRMATDNPRRPKRAVQSRANGRK